MASQARQLSNHYEVLGLSPTASQDEIGAAFERAMGNFARPLSATLHIYQAFEVLRQPEKRRAYDRSIGFAPKPLQTQFMIPPQSRMPFTVTALASGTSQPLKQADNDGERDTAAVPIPPPSVASIDIAEPIVAPERVAEPLEPFVLPEPRQEADEPALDDLVGSILAEGHAEKAALQNAERRPHDWRRVGIAAGAFVLGAGILGGLAGVSVSGPAPEDTVTDVSLPAPSPYLKGTEPVPNFKAEAEAQVRAENLAREARRLASDSERKVNPLIIPPELASASVERRNPPPATAKTTTEINTAAALVDPLAPEPAAATATEANLPLPKATISRTIERIGYPCGSVSSIATVDGVFKVTCSSGDSYRAAPVGGRYRFKKWGGA